MYMKSFVIWRVKVYILYMLLYIYTYDMYIQCKSTCYCTYYTYYKYILYMNFFFIHRSLCGA